MLRESAKPTDPANNGGAIDINNPSNTAVYISSRTKKRVNKILAVYRATQKDNWNLNITVDPAIYPQNNGPWARLKGTYDPSVPYSITYITDDHSPIVPFTGSYATNEKSMLLELTDVVRQNATTVSMLMNKKADKDISGWITPTLLNGWKRPNLELPVRYKEQNGIVYISGRISDGTVGYTTEHSVFILPSGYRPIKTMYSTVNDASYNSRYVAINPNGYVNIETGGNININLDGISFPAEQ